MQEADFIVAPLTANDRNLIQGCCPLKIIESMAVGTPVIASDLPVVRELGVNYQHFWLVKPGSAKAIKDAILTIANQPNLRQQIAIQARQQIEKYFTWNCATSSLITAYQQLLNNLSNTC
jgi:glycosyltransferase involved in cell wall biosynthesis